LRLPPYLRDKAFDDPEVIERFKCLLDYVFSQLPDLELSSLAIGNEIDGYLGTNQRLWQEYTRFFQATSAYAKTKRPNLLVGSKVGFGGLTNEAYTLSADLVRASDVVMLTYYPLNADFSVKNPEVVHEDFAKLVALFLDKPIYVLEAGYPSSPLLGSSEEKQADFIREIFRAWDTHTAHIELLDFLWLHDIPPAVVKELGDYYRLKDEKFLAYLATLGLRTFDGEDKEAFKVLRLETKKRGW
jgi:alpha-L-arabinofuranosidase